MNSNTKIYPAMQLGKWCAYWFDHTDYRRSMTTNAKYEEIITRVIQPYFRDIALCEIDTELIQKFLNELAAKGYSASRVAMIRSILGAIMCYAVNHNLIRRNPGLLANSEKRHRSDIHILSDDDIRKLIRLQNDSQYVSVTLFTLFMGLRIGETLGLSWDKVNFEENTVEISQQAVSYYKNGKTLQSIVPYTKEKNKRILPLPEIARNLLVMQRDKHIDSDNNLVFTENNGMMMLYPSFYYNFNKLMKSIGRDDVTPHDLRHTMASTLLYSTDDILLLKEFLGHNSLNTTFRYPTATLQERQETANAIDDYFMPMLCEVFGNYEGDEYQCL